MKQKLLYLLLFAACCSEIFAQEFHGAVKKSDSLSTSIYQAKVEITQGTEPFASLKTYFDGGYKFAPNKNQTYTIKISYPGYIDTTFSIKSDKTGKPSPEYLVVRLKKDGMRLMGAIKSAEENFPIKDACIILKNVMTRDEKRIYTGIDGAYNFKLEYETNYKVSIDKRSLGIFNKYKDTSFYISTIGFNQPLDYKLDIALDPMLYPSTTVREGYSPVKQPANANTKPMVEVSSSAKQTANQTASIAESSNKASEEKQPFVQEDRKKKDAQDAVAKLQAELEQTKRQLEDLKKKEAEKKTVGGASISSGNKKKPKQDPNLEVVVIRDDVKTPAEGSKTQSETVSANQLEITRLQGDAERKAKEVELAIAKQKEQEAIKKQQNKKAENLAAMQAAYDDSIAKELERKEKEYLAAVTKKNSKPDNNDQINRSIQKEQEEIERALAAKRMKQDSIAKANAKQNKNKETNLSVSIQPNADSLKLLNAAIARKKYVQDSVIFAKQAAIQQEKDKAALKKKAEEEAMQKAQAEEQNRIAEEKKKKEQLAASEKAKQEAIAKEKVEKEKAAAEQAAREKAKAESEAQAKALREKQEKEQAAQKAYQDSVSKALALFKKKELDDSIARSKAQREKIIRELKAKKAYEDSVAAAKLVFEKKAKEQAEKKRREEAESKQIALEQAAVKEAQQAEAERRAAEKKKAEELAAQERAKFLAEVRRKFVEDSITRAKAELDRAAIHEAEKRAYEDSVQKVAALERKKAFEDSLARLKYEQEKIANLLAAKKQQQEIELAARKKAEEDSIAAARAEAEKMSRDLAELKKREEADRKARELAEKKKREEEQAVKKAQEEEARLLAIEKQKTEALVAQLKAENDKKLLAESFAKAQAELAAKKAYNDSIANAIQVVKQKLIDDSVAKAKAEQERLAQEIEAKNRLAQAAAIARQKAIEDSISRVKIMADKAAFEDSINRAKMEIEKMTQELLSTRKKMNEDSLNRVIAEQERIKQEAILEEQRKNREDSINRAIAEHERMVREIEERKAREQAEITAAKAAFEDSLNKLKAEQDRIANEVKEAKVKAEAEALKRSQEEAAAKKLKEAEDVRKAAQEKELKEKQKAEENERLRIEQQELLKKEKEEKEKKEQVEEQKRLREEEDRVIKEQERRKFAVLEAEKKKEEEQRLAEDKKAIEDSLRHLKIAREAIQKSASINTQQNSTVATSEGELNKQIKNSETVAASDKNLTNFKKNISEKSLDADIPVVCFDKNSHELRSADKQRLKDIASLILADPTASIKIYALASSDENNPRQTSLWRSDAVLRQLIQYGLGIDRIKSSYFGSNISRNGCANSNCPEELLKQNRCVVYEMIKN